jgi:hypothetical protein
MPNIIEQQDLLKGLPDNRLAMMMQNPTGDIPPFLVAAEAQRRQAIREQFSGGPQESVVDTLTKQLANVPQNVQAQPQTPPQMPPPMMQPEMAGVAALQQQMPQQAPQQAMRRGGYVQRYQEGSLVVPSVGGLAGSITGMTKEEFLREQERKRLESLGPGKARYLLENPTLPTSEREIAERELRAATEGPLSGFYSPESVYEAAKSVTETQAPKSDPFSYGMTRDERQMMQRAPVPEPPPIEPGKEPTSAENQSKVSLEEYRKQLENIYGVNAGDSEYIKGKIQELYGSGEPSSWEKSQKWFAAAQAAIQPGQNNWQATINALSALGGGMAEERASERENQQALAEAMLRYEMADMQERRQSERDIAKASLAFQIQEQEDADARAAAARAERLGAYKFYAEGAGESIEAANQSIRSLVMERKEYLDSLPKDMATGQPVTADGKPVSAENDPVLRSIEEQIRSYRDMISGASAQRQKALGGYGTMTGTDPSVLTYSPGRLTPYGG